MRFAVCNASTSSKGDHRAAQEAEIYTGKRNNRLHGGSKQILLLPGEIEDPQSWIRGTDPLAMPKGPRAAESGDDEYRGEQSESDDEVDSDFDIDEGDEPGSEADESEPRPRRRGLPRAYREPIKTLRSKKPDAPSGSQRAKPTPSELQDEVVDSECRKHMRQSTTEHTRQTFLRLQERQVQSKRKKGGPNHERPLTQEELLEEAKITEEINLRSLENYERLEADKKKQVHKKRKCVGPVIRYWSVTMPLVTELGKEENVDVEGLDQEAQQAEAPAAAAGKCSRTFITFSDDETFERFFPKAKPPRVPVRELCPVTHKPAVYRDPVTDIPYSNIRAFKIIREAYKKYITAHGLPGAATAAAKIIIKQSVPAT
ncbi:vacuolar protein sorting-associated protein 72 homolog [Nothoprocta perdicaria]|uniref:vacuolar protein sorting-associated protein 72 homolog n=1 Tax=Nothoprocta perdicaria TaxID=30464 RepID=UPI000E1BE66B|nr:vacuolar protein sorting-associated protein 72 homolog [Nothoprocta perdicaria]